MGILSIHGNIVNIVYPWEYCLSKGILSIHENIIYPWEYCLSTGILSIHGNIVYPWEYCLSMGILSIHGILSIRGNIIGRVKPVFPCRYRQNRLVEASNANMLEESFTISQINVYYYNRETSSGS